MLADEVTQSPLGEYVAGHLGVGVGQRGDAGLRRGGRARRRGACQLHPTSARATAALAGTAARRTTTGRLAAGRPHRAGTASGYRASAAAAVATAEYIHRQSERRMEHPSIRFTRCAKGVSRAFFEDAWPPRSGSTA